VSPFDPALDECAGLCAASAVSISAARLLSADRVDLNIAKLLVEEAVVRPPPEFTVGDKSQADLLLQPDSGFDCLILEVSQCSAVDFTPLETRAMLQQILWPEQATDMFRPKGRFEVGQIISSGEGLGAL
jgi:hypothetical protein